MNEDWLLPGATKDRQGITKDWDFVGQELIDGVMVREIKNVPAGYGVLTEVYRRDWFSDLPDIDQVFQSRLEPGRVSAWHAHALTIDRLFVSAGNMLVALYDGRKNSRSFGLVNTFRLNLFRPCVLIVPPKIWHGISNIGQEQSTILNMVDRAYSYEDPDHWRLAQDSSEIPFHF